MYLLGVQSLGFQSKIERHYQWKIMPVDNQVIRLVEISFEE